MEEDPTKEQQKLDDLKGILESSTERGVDSFHPVFKEFLKNMESKYGVERCSKSKAWHVLNGSVPDPTSEISCDLPEGEVEHFIRHELPLLEPVEIEIKPRSLEDITSNPPPGVFFPPKKD